MRVPWLEGAKGLKPRTPKNARQTDPKKSACSDVPPRLMVSGSAAKFKLLTGDRNKGRLNSHLGTNITNRMSHTSLCRVIVKPSVGH